MATWIQCRVIGQAPKVTISGNSSRQKGSPCAPTRSAITTSAPASRVPIAHLVALTSLRGEATTPRSIVPDRHTQSLINRLAARSRRTHSWVAIITLIASPGEDVRSSRACAAEASGMTLLTSALTSTRALCALRRSGPGHVNL